MVRSINLSFFLSLLWFRGVENIWKGEKSEGKKKIYIYNESKKLE